MKVEKQRIDKLLAERSLVSSRERAQAMILAGRVLVNEQKVTKAGQAVAVDAEIRLLGDQPRYVSRGGLKLEAALRHWSIAVEGRGCMDVGTSTGGFTDCLLQAGAAAVVAVDTGRGQIDAHLRTHPKLRLMENTNARFLEASQVPEELSLMVMDVSFISATLVLPAVVRALWAGREIEPRESVVLVKPQFEVGREKIGKGGIVRDAAAQQGAVDKLRACAVELGAAETDVIDSPILGMEGNREFLLYTRWNRIG
jgi:23S rRNA (cytidine1920-2'-O)/16S rRNA (cytidine1409-2'-O)-methyltransferase